MNAHEKRAWDLYCRETAGDMNVADFWEDLHETIQTHYLARTRFRVRGAGTVTRDAESQLRKLCAEQCESVLERAREGVSDAIERVVHAQLRAIHRRSFPGRRLSFLDAMGSAGVDLWDRDGGHRRVKLIGHTGILPSYYARSAGIRDLNAVLDWYTRAARDAHVSINELELQPETLED